VSAAAALDVEHPVVAGCGECGASARLGHACPGCGQLALDVEGPAGLVRLDPAQLVLPGMAPPPSTIRALAPATAVI
jgi:hypothetical protein